MEGGTASKAASEAERAAPRLVWLREEPTARRPAHTRSEIVAAALAIADEDGFGALSMRRVAERLGAGTMTLYHYVANKDELVTLMFDAVAGEVLIPDAELAPHWRAAMRQIATRTREVFRRHRWALDRLDASRPVPSGVSGFEQALSAFADVEISDEAKFELITMIEDYVYGFVLREMRERVDQERGWDPEVLEFFQRQLSDGEYPLLRSMLGEDVETGFDRFGDFFLSETRFERGLERLLDGIEVAIERELS